MVPLAEMGGELKSFFQEKQRASVHGRPVPSAPGGDKDKTGEPNASSGDSSMETKQQIPSLPKRDPSTKVSSGTHLPHHSNIYVNGIPRGNVKI